MAKDKITSQQQINSEEDEIDLIALVKTLWEGRKTIIKITLIFMAIGLFIAVFSQKEYTASTTFVPQTSDGKSIGGNLGGLAAMAGINLGNISSNSGISPDLYPQIVNSIPFQLELLETPLTIEGQNEKISFKNYYDKIYSPGLLGYLKKYTIGLPGLIINSIKGKPKVNEQLKAKNQLISVSSNEYELIEQLRDQIVLDVNDKDGYVSVAIDMPESIASAELTQKTLELLQQYIIDFKVQEFSDQLQFIEERYKEKEAEFKKIQQKLARFQDRNQFTNSALAQTNLMRLQSEYDLAYDVYAELAKQLETQKIQVKEDTPVFTVLKPVSVPVEKSKPKRIIILIIWTFLGFVLSVAIILGMNFYSRLTYY